MEITGENIREIIDKSYDAGVTDTVERAVRILEDICFFYYIRDKETGTDIDASKVIEKFKKRMLKK
jgi:hypothetical protein